MPNPNRRFLQQRGAVLEMNAEELAVIVTALENDLARDPAPRDYKAITGRLHRLTRQMLLTMCAASSAATKHD